MEALLNFINSTYQKDTVTVREMTPEVRFGKYGFVALVDGRFFRIEVQDCEKVVGSNMLYYTYSTANRVYIYYSPLKFLL